MNQILGETLKIYIVYGGAKAVDPQGEKNSENELPLSEELVG
jgi:hypothetical protein